MNSSLRSTTGGVKTWGTGPGLVEGVVDKAPPPLDEGCPHFFTLRSTFPMNSFNFEIYHGRGDGVGTGAWTGRGW